MFTAHARRPKFSRFEACACNSSLGKADRRISTHWSSSTAILGKSLSQRKKMEGNREDTQRARTHTHSLMIWVPQTKTLMKTECSFSPGSQPSTTVNSAPYTHCDTLEAAPLSCPRTKQRQDLAWALGSVYLLT